LEKVYALDPIPAGLAPADWRHILGAQGNVWTEYIPNIRHVEYMAFPRLCALAEVTWSPKAARNYDNFLQRLKTNERRLDESGLNYRSPALGNGIEPNGIKVGSWSPSQITTSLTPLEWDVTSKVTAAGRAKVRFDYTSGASGLVIAAVVLLEDGREISRDTHEGFAGGQLSMTLYTLDVPAPKAGAHYMLNARVAGAGGTNSQGDIFWNFKPVDSK
jgi:hexosaminidase